MQYDEEELIYLEFRTADMDDLQEVWDLYAAVVMESSGTEEDPYWEMGKHPSMDELSYQIEDETLYVATLYGEIVAATVIEQTFVGGYDLFPWKSGIPLRDVAVLRMFAVSTEFRGQHISSRFLRYCIDAIKEQGYKAIRLDIMPHLKHAQALYLNAGFENQGMAQIDHMDPRMRNSLMFELVL